MLLAAVPAAAAPVPRIEVLSNRADLVSGGDALVRVTVPRGVKPSRLRFTAGRLEDPLVGRARPTPTQDHGRGLWLVHQLCDLVQLRSGEAGTVARVSMARA